ncbi:uncharacterized protein TNCV_768611 [Trichonephila clavipes]|nr:uncharacterized protein TNCV_768611 [Trichonephila clavipes]
MPFVSDPCSCQPDCLVCGRGKEPPHDCAIHVLLESMVFQEGMLHGEPTEPKLEEILQRGKEYLPLAMHMTDEYSVRWQTMYNYVKSGFPQHQGNYSRNCFFKSHHVVQNSPASSTLSTAAMIGKDGKLYFRLVDVGAFLGHSKVYLFAKRFDNLVIQGKDVLPAHKQYPVMTQKSKLVIPDVVFNILNAELSSLATSFATSLNVGFALVEYPSNLFVESYKTSPVLHVQDSPVPNSILVRLLVQNFIQKLWDMRRMQNGSKPLVQMVYEACLRAGARPSVEPAEVFSLPERIPPAQRPSEPERMPTPPAEPVRPAEPEKMTTPPAERPPLEMVDPSVFVNTVEVTTRIPPLITRCDKGTQTISPYLHLKRLDLGKRRMEQPQVNKRLSIKQEPSENRVSKNIVLLVPRNHPFMKLGNNGYSSFNTQM